MAGYIVLCRLLTRPSQRSFKEAPQDLHYVDIAQAKSHCTLSYPVISSVNICRALSNRNQQSKLVHDDESSLSLSLSVSLSLCESLLSFCESPSLSGPVL